MAKKPECTCAEIVGDPWRYDRLQEYQPGWVAAGCPLHDPADSNHTGDTTETVPATTSDTPDQPAQES